MTVHGMATTGGQEARGPQRPWNASGIWSLVTFNWVAGLIKRANVDQELEPEDAYKLLPTYDDAHALSQSFEEEYARVKARRGEVPSSHLVNNTTWTLIRLYRRDLLLHALWVLMEVVVRLLSPLILRQFLLWLQSDNQGENPTLWRGWLLAFTLGVAGFAMAVMHHRLFWTGMHAGFAMRQQCVAAVHAKALRLNAAAVAHISPGHVVNLVSNDVRRFDDALPFWVFLWAGPLELGMVLLMVSLELGFLPALAGISTTLALIPIQALLVRPVAGIRRANATQTDERVRLTGEVITGALAMKMLSWELPFSKAVGEIRQREAKHVRQMARIKAVNQALVFAITPVVSFTTFAVYRALNGGLSVASVFYSLSLLRLPALYMVQFFVLGLQSNTELKVSLMRLDKFLSTQEPPMPTHMREAAVKANGKESGMAIKENGQHAKGNGVHAVELATSSSSDGRSSEDGQGGKVAGSAGPACHVPGTVELRGADYDWSRPLGYELQGAHDAAVEAKVSRRRSRRRKDANGADSAATSQPQSSAGSDVQIKPLGVTLQGIRLELKPGELLGVCGEVGSGKSSLLAALLGELQPLPAPYGDGPVVIATSAALAQQGTGTTGSSDELGPVVTGKVAYCSQVPWIVAASVRDNILFGQPYEPQRYSAVLAACALDTDIQALPAGDQTELGERGINLSGGQKARVALARAAYACPDVALLDDPLSAVDPRVARILFSKCIGNEGVLKASTRVLVTHQRQFLPQCDRVMVLRHGEVHALGTWADIDALQLPELLAGANGPMGDTTVDELVEDTQQKTTTSVDSPAAPAANTTPAGGAVESGGDDSQSATVAVVLDGVGVEDGEGEQGEGAAVQAERGESAAEYVERVMDGQSAASATDAAAAAAAAANGSAQRTANGWGGKPELGARSQGGLGESPSFMRRAFSNIFARGPASGLGRSRSGWMRSETSGRLQAVEEGVMEAPTVHWQQDVAGGARGLSLRWRQGSVSRALDRVFSRSTVFRTKSTAARAAKQQDANKGALVQAEDRILGTVPWRVYGQWCRHVGLFISSLVTVGMFGGQACFLASEWWLALWSRASDQSNVEWLWVYGMLTGLVVVVGISRALLFFEASVSAATRIHDEMAITVFRAPLSFFHTNPAGRILNRFSKDLGQVDDLLPVTFFDAMQCGFLVLSAFVLVSIAVPFILPVFLPLTAAFIWLRARYLCASREVKRWEATSRSPVFASFSATLKGLPTIRAYNAMARFQDTFLGLLSHNGAWFHAFLGVSRWIGYRLDVISATTLMAAALLAMAARDRVQPSLLALALTHVLQLTGFMQWFVRQTAEVENIMTSMERMLEYTDLDQEPPLVSEGGKKPPEGWPRTGALEYENVTAVYRPGLDPVLVDITFKLEGGTSCGVVGRTGSGKSSLMLTLFRLIPVTRGVIRLDGVDTAALGLDALRKQLAIIPQDPVLFSGTVRSNLDPWNVHQDEALWRALSAAKLQSVISAAGGLGSRMSEAGDNLSVGQRQLFCLARALLQQAKVLALDEATANVDRGTDALIQDALRAFAEEEGRVLLVIAHRIDTILDTDSLLVLNQGRLVEHGNPQQLAAQKGGVFAGMVAAAQAAMAQPTPISGAAPAIGSSS